MLPNSGSTITIEQGVLEESTGQRRNRLYAVPSVIAIAYGEPESDHSINND